MMLLVMLLAISNLSTLFIGMYLEWKFDLVTRATVRMAGYSWFVKMIKRTENFT